MTKINKIQTDHTKRVTYFVNVDDVDYIYIEYIETATNKVIDCELRDENGSSVDDPIVLDLIQNKVDEIC